jgi:glycosyltransferase involved in cell wall biosynthesis
VVVCTRNRAELLAGLLVALDRQTIREHLDVLVIDNGSTDGTALAVQRAGVRSLVEPEVGLSRARNRGLAATGTEVVLFTDDDVRPDPRWAEELVAVFDDPSVAAAGGPVRLGWPNGEPRWISWRLAQLFAAVDHGGEPRVLPPGCSPFGPSFAVRRSAALAAGGFDVSLGLVGDRLGYHEEVDLMARLRALGGSVVWRPAAEVLHLVGPERARRRWVLRRMYGQGASDERAGVRGHLLGARELLGALSGAVLRPTGPEALEVAATASQCCGRVMARVRRFTEVTR